MADAVEGMGEGVVAMCHTTPRQRQMDSLMVQAQLQVQTRRSDATEKDHKFWKTQPVPQEGGCERGAVFAPVC
jgi:hypothetical protein